MRTRTGKIARLPEPIRQEINQLFQDGRTARELVPWLNELPDVNQVLADHFGGRPITEHNLSEWRLGGYQDWLRQNETRERVLRLTQKCQHPDSLSRLNAQTGILLAAELLDASNELHEIKDSSARSARLRRLCHEFARIQKGHTLDLALRLQLEKAQARQAALQTNTSKLGVTRT